MVAFRWLRAAQSMFLMKTSLRYLGARSLRHLKPSVLIVYQSTARSFAQSIGRYFLAYFKKPIAREAFAVTAFMCSFMRDVRLIGHLNIQLYLQLRHWSHKREVGKFDRKSQDAFSYVWW